MYSSLKVRINIDFVALFKRVTRERQNSIQLWLLARAIDKEGSGKATIDLEEAAKTLKRSVQTLRLWTETLIKKRIFKNAVWNSDRTEVTVYLLGRMQMARKMRLSGLANLIEISAEQLPAAKLFCTEAWAIVKQRGSEWLASKGGKRKLFTYEDLVNPSSALCSGARGKIFRRSKRFVCVSNNTTHFGGSQAKNAWEQGFHRTTISRHLSSDRREKEGLDPLERVQILKLRPDSEKILGTDQERPYKTIAIDGADGKQYLYNFKCNVYRESDLKIMPDRAAKRRYKLYLKELEANKKSRQTTSNTNALINASVAAVC